MKSGSGTVRAVLVIGMAPVIAVATAIALAIALLSFLLSRLVLNLLTGTGRYLPSNTRDDQPNRPQAATENQTTRADKPPTPEDVRRNLDRLVRHVELSVRTRELGGPVE